MSNLDKTHFLHKLYDIYGILLTDKQKDYFELYYFEDLSLAEIAEELAVSRNAVHKNLQQTIKNLNNYEDKLQIITKKEVVYQKLKDNGIEEQLIQEINDIL